MRCIDLIASFELEINKLDDAVNKPVTDDSVYWINQAVMKFVKERFNGNSPKRTSYEQNEKRTRDLINLLREDVHMFTEPTSSETHPDYDEYEYTYPGYKEDDDREKMLYALNEDVIITDTAGEYSKDVSVFECTADNFMYRIMNHLTDFHYRYHTARPLRIRTKNGFKLLTDKNYRIGRYSLGYIKVPTEIKTDDPYEDYKDFEDNIWAEIIKIAA